MRSLMKLTEWFQQQLQLDADFRWYRKRGFTRKAAWFNAQNTLNSPTRRS